MDTIRAPWRMEYITSPKDNSSAGECIFCRYPQEDDDAENLIVVRGINTFVMLNRYPYSCGHLMVVPYRHTAEFSTLTDVEVLELISNAKIACKVFEAGMNAEGINMGINIGKAAGAGIDTHLHLHVVPRYHGDTNFMTVTGETRVLPEALAQTRDRITALWDIYK